MAIRMTRSDLHWRAHFCITEDVELPNGNVKKQNVEKFARWVGQYNASATYQHTITGFNRMTDVIIAVPRQFKDPIGFQLEYQLWTVKINDVEYDIKEIDPNANDLVGYHLITLRRRSNNNVTLLT